VRAALEQLATIDEPIISNIVCRQAGRTLLTNQIEYVLNLVEEGFLSVPDSEKFLELARKDLVHLEEHVRREFRFKSFLCLNFHTF
jgi:hypothetical protein